MLYPTGLVLYFHPSGQPAPDSGRLSLPCPLQGHRGSLQHEGVFRRLQVSGRVADEPEEQVRSLVTPSKDQL